jgi:fructose-bisphosphate aldolase/2-amino-3,7-dideoxy-D-threo-hept-6-ulosonate synthase
MFGKQIRLRQILDWQNRSFILAADQVIPQGLHTALQDPIVALEKLKEAKFDAFLLHSGIVKLARNTLIGGKPFIIKLTTATTLSRDKTHRFVIDSVEHALSLGAVGVSMNLFVGSDYEAQLFEQFSQAVQVCDRFGVPMLAMAHPMPEKQYDTDLQAYACRVAAELGADMVKTDYPGSPEAFQRISAHCPVPVLVEESPYEESQAGTLQTAREAMQAGGSGVLFGRRVWAHAHPQQIAAEIYGIVHSTIGA